jgi:hypothetical protein
MTLLEKLMSAIDPANIAATRSRIVGDGQREADLDLSGQVPLSCGATLSFRLHGAVPFTHDEVALALGKTRAEVDALTAVEVETSAPFTGAVTAKVLADLGG